MVLDVAACTLLSRSSPLPFSLSMHVPAYALQTCCSDPLQVQELCQVVDLWPRLPPYLSRRSSPVPALRCRWTWWSRAWMIVCAPRKGPQPRMLAQQTHWNQQACHGWRRLRGRCRACHCHRSDFLAPPASVTSTSILLGTHCAKAFPTKPTDNPRVVWSHTPQTHDPSHLKTQWILGGLEQERVSWEGMKKGRSTRK